MLHDCYNAANVISNNLDKELSTHRSAEYRELLNNFKLLIDQFNWYITEGKSRAGISSEISHLLLQIQNKLLTESEVKLEIAFMPYKASMWDCLESVWRAANDDSRCECYVIPIPYYERNPDHSIGTFQYEGYQFPKDVSIVDYRSYNLSERRPDIVYIHNPYDGNNRVTSVAPEYYSNEIKKNTGILVYIPYYVTGDVVSGHLISSAANQYVDKIIVQSKQVEEQYSKYIPSDKFASIGSPKIDRLLRYEQCDVEIPCKWKEIICNKQVILYNTSLANLLANTSEIIPKIRYVFSCFESRDDVVLLWRPHPLSKPTLASIRPHVWQEYCQLEDEYKAKAFGVFDDTPDIEASIAVSDAYFGDASSIIYMYGVTGKQMMVQDWNIHNENKNEGAFSYKGDFEKHLFDYCYMENDGLTLNEFLNYVASGKYHKNPLQINAFKRLFENADGTCGQKTHQYIVSHFIT